MTIRTAIVVVPTLNEEAQIGRVLRELLRDLPDGAEIVVADGGSRDATCERVAAIAARDPRVRLVGNPHRVQSAALNQVARSAAGQAQWLIRADAHAAYPPGFVARVIATLRRTGADAVVVPMDSTGQGCIGRAIAWVSDTPVGSGGSAHRGGRRAGWIDHGHHAGWNLASYLAAGGYDESFSHNEDAEFDCRLRRLGGRIWIDPAIRLTYFVRSDLAALWRQYRNYGRGRSRTVRRHPGSVRLRQIAVPAGVSTIALATIATPFLPWLGLVPAAYLLLLGLVALDLVRRHRSRCGLGAVPAAMVMHFAWAWGFVTGWFTAKERRWRPGRAQVLPLQEISG